MDGGRKFLLFGVGNWRACLVVLFEGRFGKSAFLPYCFCWLQRRRRGKTKGRRDFREYPCLYISVPPSCNLYPYSV